MSSWFSGNLSQNFSDLTGQLSNFTKEVLTEGTEEQDGKYIASAHWYSLYQSA